LLVNRVPIERASKSFKDISMSFKVSPLTFDLIANKNETAIARSIRNLILTAPGERPFNPELGSQVSRLLFDPIDDITTEALREQIENTINNFEPRAELSNVICVGNIDENRYEVSISFYMRNSSAEEQTVDVFLERLR